MVRKRRFGKTFWILFFILIISALVVFSIFTQKTQKNSRWKDAKDYFRIENATVVGQFEEPEDETLRVIILRFDLIAIGGDANLGVVIPGEGNVAEGYYPRFEYLAQGQSTPINIYYQQRPSFFRTSDGFYQLHVRIDCYEAEGSITINATLLGE